MRFTVEWTPPAEGELAEIWLAAVDRNAVNDAARRIDQQLGTDPAGVGESRPPRRRILFDPPLAVIFQVDESGGTVHVLSVGWSGRPV